MFSLILSLFTGGSKWIYIALVALSIALIGVSSLSISLYGDKSDLEEKVIFTNKILDEQAKELKKINKELAQTKADLQTQNALNEQYAVDIQKRDKEYQEAMAKKPTFKTEYIQIDRTDNEAQDLINFVKKWRDKK